LISAMLIVYKKIFEVSFIGERRMQGMFGIGVIPGFAYNYRQSI